jgi:KilA-N domain
LKKSTTTITVEGTTIRVLSEKEEQDFYSLTDIAKRFGERSDQIIGNWIRTRTTLSFLAVWEQMNNENFNSLKFEGIRNQAGSPTFVLSIADWVNQTSAIGIYAKAGRYGGTYAHRDIALEFCSWIEPAFRLYIIKEFQRLKTDEGERLSVEWNVRRLIAKTNYKIHTDTIKYHLIPQRIEPNKTAGMIYASEADLLNMAIFGMTAKQWKEHEPNATGNLRDHASTEQLLVLSNLESLNSELIKMGFSRDERLDKLNDTAISQMKIIVQSNAFDVLKNDNEGQDNLQLPAIG